MKKVFVAFVLLGAGVAVGYTQGLFDRFLDSETVAEGKTANHQGKGEGDARALFDAGNFQDAASVLEERASAQDGLSDQDLVLLAETYTALENPEMEKKAWETLLHDHADSPLSARALWGLASLAKRENRPEKALGYCQKIVESHPRTAAGAKAASELGDHFLAAGQKTEARRAYSTALGAAGTAERKRIKKILTGLNRDVLFSGAPGKDMTVYPVEPGDSLARIARRHGTTVGLIKILNRLEGNIIHPGQQLKIMQGEVRLEVHKSTFTLTVYIGGLWFKDYQVGVGKNDRTPEGEFEIANRIVDPPWFWKGEAIPAGDPRNILGTRWMGFKNKPGLTGFGIHGTTEPEGIPGAVSRGCIRMRNEDVEELFHFVPLGTKVLIQD